jgi:hypothetical protein
MKTHATTSRNPTPEFVRQLELPWKQPEFGCYLQVFTPIVSRQPQQALFIYTSAFFYNIGQ